MPIIRSARQRALAAGLLAAGLLYVLYVTVDPERRNLDDTVRAGAPGQFVRLSDGYTHYEVSGPSAAPIVVLAAGASVPYYIWDPTFAALTAAGFRVLRYDYYGRGFSDRPAIAYSQQVYVRQLGELLDALGFTHRVALAGLSMGASIVTSFAAVCPDRVGSIIYVDPAFRSPEPVPVVALVPWVWNFTSALVEEHLWAAEQLGDFRHPERYPDWPARYRVQMQYRGFRRARRSDLVVNARLDQTAELKQVGQHSRPVLVIWGKEDPSVSFDDSGALMKVMPRARLVAVEDAGHLPQIEQPGIVNAAIIDFLHRQ